METKRVITTPEVYAVIMASHGGELKAFSTFSNPDGTFNGGPGEEGVMLTEFGFADAGAALIGAETRWEINRATPHKRINECHKYWLCLPLNED